MVPRLMKRGDSPMREVIVGPMSIYLKVRLSCSNLNFSLFEYANSIVFVPLERSVFPCPPNWFIPWSPKIKSVAYSSNSFISPTTSFKFQSISGTKSLNKDWFLISLLWPAWSIPTIWKNVASYWVKFYFSTSKPSVSATLRSVPCPPSVLIIFVCFPAYSLS